MFNAVVIDLSSGVQVLGRSISYGDINEGISAMETLAIHLTGTPEQIARRLAEEEKRRLAAERQQGQQRLADERQKKADERKRKADERKNAFLRASGIGVSLSGGVSFALFVPADGPVLEGSGPVFFTCGASPELLIGRHFSIQPELQFTLPKYKTPELKEGEIVSKDKMYPIMQAPLLIKGRFDGFAVFGGIGYNIPLQFNVSSPLYSAIGGFQLSPQYSGSEFFPFYLEARFIYDFGETGMKTAYGSFSGQMISFCITLGIRKVWHFR
jgi:hypothetical protein